jgi:NAD(P)-dependent dehydrogenase (short-subunit alcohol dehydrogenase family)
MKPRFKGRVVLVTGAGSGIGRAAALAFAREGARVAVNDLSPSAAAETCRKIRRARGGRALPLPGDVSDPRDAERLVAETEKRLGPLHVLVNNAGIGTAGTILDTPDGKFDEILRVNVKGAWLLSRAALKRMIPRKKGVIVNTGSIASVRGIPERAAYTVSKHAVLGLTRALAVDHVKDGIRVNCLCPGTTLTPWIDRRLQEAADPEAALRALTARQPMGRLGKPEEMAEGILYLASDEAAFATGTALVVDGGFCA